MVRLLELRIPDEGLAVLAPIFWLSLESGVVRRKVWVGNLPLISSIPTSLPTKQGSLFAPNVCCYSTIWSIRYQI